MYHYTLSKLRVDPPVD